MSELKSFHDWMFREDFATSIIDFESTVGDFAKFAKGLAGQEVDDYTIDWTTRHWNSFFRRIDEDRIAGRIGVFEVADPVTRRLRYLPKCPTLTKSTLRDKCISERISHTLRCFDSLNHREYEGLSAAILQFIGATQVFVTPKGNEKNIDFCATILPKNQQLQMLLNLNLAEFRIIGQTKRYASQVDNGEMELFSQTLSNIRYKSPDTYSKLPQFFQEKCGPIIGCMFSKNGIQSGALNVAKRHGILNLDDYDAASLLSSSIDWKKSIPDYVNEIRTQVLRLAA